SVISCLNTLTASAFGRQQDQKHDRSKAAEPTPSQIGARTVETKDGASSSRSKSKRGTVVESALVRLMPTRQHLARPLYGAADGGDRTDARYPRPLMIDKSAQFCCRGSDQPTLLGVGRRLGQDGLYCGSSSSLRLYMSAASAERRA